jgi:hypothetical protein
MTGITALRGKFRTRRRVSALAGTVVALLVLAACAPARPVSVSTAAPQAPTPAHAAAQADPTTTTSAPVPAPTPTTVAPTPTTAPVPTTTVPVSGPGMVGGGGFSEGSMLLWGTNGELAQELDGMKALGGRWVRVDVDWSVIERTQGVYDWSVPDRVIDAARARGMNVLGMLAYTPTWARVLGGTDKSRPADPTNFHRFAGAAAAHYAGRVQAFEIWNEPNMTMFFQPAPDPAAYAELLVGAYDAIKAVTPDATVVTGGLSPAPDSANGSTISPNTFLNGVYDAGGGGHFDAVGHHPSNYPYSPLRPESVFNYNAFAGVTPVLHQTMVNHADGAKRIWATEMGAPVPYTVSGVRTTPEYLATYLTEATNQWRQWAWTGPMFWYSYRDAGTDPNNIEDLFGLVTRSFVPKEPAFSSMRAAFAVPTN